MPMPALSIDNVTCTFPARGDRGTYTAIRDVSLTVADGEFVSLVGPTGCGNSTLLNAAAGLLAPTSGSVSVFGAPLAGTNREAGYLFQTDALFPWRNALDNVTAGLEFRGIAKDEARARATEWLTRVGLAQHMAKYPHELSGGMRKRVALAQTWILGPRILAPSSEISQPVEAVQVL